VTILTQGDHHADGLDLLWMLYECYTAMWTRIKRTRADGELAPAFAYPTASWFWAMLRPCGALRRIVYAVTW
jgi:hypothetical protein